MQLIPIIPKTKNYWLVRTQGGKYYEEYRKNGFIAINWDEISVNDIKNLSREDLENKIKEYYPKKKKPGRAAGQLKTFTNLIKKGDTVVITSYSSNQFSVGEVLEDDCYTEEVSPKQLEVNNKLCSFQKRKKVKWIKEVHKWDVEFSMFKLLQHAQNTISDANDYADVIESMIHDFYIRGAKAELTLRVKKEGNIPWNSFFSMGNEISELASDFNTFTNKYSINMDEIDTKVNINSPGKIKLSGPAKAITALGLIVVLTAGGGISVPLPEVLGGGIDVQFNGLLQEVTNYLDHREAREKQDLLLKEHMDDLEVETPAELAELLEAVKPPVNPESPAKE